MVFISIKSGRASPASGETGAAFSHALATNEICPDDSPAGVCLQIEFFSTLKSELHEKKERAYEE